MQGVYQDIRKEGVVIQRIELFTSSIRSLAKQKEKALPKPFPYFNIKTELKKQEPF